jgi:hypothetical protein
MSSEKREWSGGWLFLLVPVFLVVGYALSVGPVGLVWERMGWDVAKLRVMYAPHMWLHKNTRLRGPLEWYDGLWAGK